MKRNKKTIVFFNGFYIPHLGGVERYTNKLSEQDIILYKSLLSDKEIEINNLDELRDECFKNGRVQFIEMNKGLINPTEMVAALINQKPTIVEGLKYAQEKIKGSMSILLLFLEHTLILLQL